MQPSKDYKKKKASKMNHDGGGGQLKWETKETSDWLKTFNPKVNRRNICTNELKAVKNIEERGKDQILWKMNEKKKSFWMKSI